MPLPPSLSSLSPSMSSYHGSHMDLISIHKYRWAAPLQTERCFISSRHVNANGWNLYTAKIGKEEDGSEQATTTSLPLFSCPSSLKPPKVVTLFLNSENTSHGIERFASYSLFKLNTPKDLQANPPQSSCAASFPCCEQGSLSYPPNQNALMKMRFRMARPLDATQNFRVSTSGSLGK